MTGSSSAAAACGGGAACFDDDHEASLAGLKASEPVLEPVRLASWGGGSGGRGGGSDDGENEALRRGMASGAAAPSSFAAAGDGTAREGAPPAALGASEGEALVSEAVRTLLAMGFSLPRAVQAHAQFGDDLESMLAYLLEQ